MSETNERDTYLEQQAKWVKQTGVKAGDKVTVLAKANSYFPDDWTEAMDAIVGQTGTVLHENDITGVFVEFEGNTVYALPFFVLAVADA